MAVAAIVFGNLKSEALYVASFHVELFSDSNYSVLVGSKACAAVRDSDSLWVQSDLIGFDGLVRGQTYYYQAGPVSPGGVANFVRGNIQAGTLTIPACTYTGTFAATSSGVSYDITPGSVPSDIDHYEAIWTKDGSAPSNSSLENNWQGSTLPSGVMHLFVGGSPGQNIHLFMRAISTSGGYQNWVAVDNRTVSPATTGSTNAAGIFYADGTSVEDLKPASAGADVTGANVSADTAAVNGINSGHVADTATSVGFVGKWWRTSSASPSPAAGGELSYAPFYTTHDASINYNIYGYNAWAGAIVPSPPTWLSSYPGTQSTNDAQYVYIRFTGYFVCNQTGTYTFGVNCDDGANLIVNGTAIVSQLAATSHGTLTDRTYLYQGTIALTAGDTYSVVVEYRNGVNNAGIQVLYTPPGGSVQLLDLGKAFSNAAFTTYTDGTPVDALQPAAAGADVTSVNVSADTSAVGGRAADEVAQTVLSGGGINYLSGSNQNLPQNANSLLIRGSFEDGLTGTWGPGCQVVAAPAGHDFTKYLVIFNRDNFEYGNDFPVVAGQRIYCYGWASTQGIPTGYGSCGFGLAYKNGAGTIVGFARAVGLNPQTGWGGYSGYLTVPSGISVATAIPWIQIDHDATTINTNYSFWLANLFYSKTAVVDFSEATHVNKNADNIPYADGSTIQSLKPAQVGADVTGSNTANNTNNVASVPATTIASVVPNGYKLYINSGSRSYSIQAI